MISTQNQVFQDNLPSWNHFSLKDLKHGIGQTSTVLINHFLVILVHDSCEDDPDFAIESKYKPTTLLSIDLQDNSIQEAEVPHTLFERHSHYSFSKYKDNQIIKFGGKEYGRNLDLMVRITIQSFDRIDKFQFL